MATPPSRSPAAAPAAEARPAAPPVRIVLNGEPHAVAAEATVLDLVAGLGRDPRTVAVERNGELVPRAQYRVTPLAEGDRLEVVHFVQGG